MGDWIDPERRKQYQRDYQRKWRQSHQANVRKIWLKSKYGLTPEDYDSMMAAQGGICKLCGEREASHCDHDHTTGVVRAMLCHHCNTALGNLFDNPDLCERAALYLREGGNIALR